MTIERPEVSPRSRSDELTDESNGHLLYPDFYLMVALLIDGSLASPSVPR
jgi:hypothetical protein